MKSLKESLITKKNIKNISIFNEYLNDRYFFLYIPYDVSQASNLLGEDDGLLSMYCYWCLSLSKLKDFVKRTKHLDPKDSFYAIKKEEYAKKEINEFDKTVDEWSPSMPQDELNNWPRIPNEDIMKLKK